MITQIFNPIAELVICKIMPTKERKAETKIQPAKAEVKMSMRST